MRLLIIVTHIFLYSCSQNPNVIRTPAANIDRSCSSLVKSLLEENTQYTSSALQIKNKILQEFNQRYLQRFPSGDVDGIRISQLEGLDIQDRHYYKLELVDVNDTIMAKIAIARGGESLRFDINVNSGFRGLGLYYLLLSHITEKVPEVKYIPAQFKFPSSDNASIFIKEAFNLSNPNDSFLRSFYSQQFINMDNLQRKLFRQNIIRGFHKTPSTKARKKVGFGKVNKIIFDAKESILHFSMEKGPPSRFDEIKVYIKTSSKNDKTNISVFEISKNGSLIFKDNSSQVLDLNGFVGNIEAKQTKNVHIFRQ